MQYGLEKQNQVIEQIFRSYFEGAKDISKLDVLVAIATSCGLDTEKVLLSAVCFPLHCAERSLAFLTDYRHDRRGSS